MFIYCIKQCNYNDQEHKNMRSKLTLIKVIKDKYNKGTVED